MAYPTSPSEVGLLSAKGDLVLDSRTSITANETITGKYFPNPVRVSGGAVVSFGDCWFYGGGDHSLRISESTVTLTNCEFGIFDIEGWDADTHVVSIQLWNDGSGGTFDCSDSYFHHGGDSVRIGANDVLDHCFMHDLVLGSEDHADTIQCIGGSGWSITNCWIECNDSGYLPDGATPNRSVQLNALTPITGYLIADCYMDSEGFYALGINDEQSGSVLRNRFGRSALSGAIFNLAFPSTVVHSDNRYLDDLSPVEGETVPAAYEAIDVQNTTTSSLTFTLPSAASTDDLILVGIRVRTYDGTITAPAGFDLVELQESTSGTSHAVAVYEKVVTGSDTPGTTTYTFTFSVAFRNLRGALLVYSDVDTTTPIAASDAAFDSGFNTAFVAPAVTTTANDQRVVAFFVSHQDTSVSSPSPSMTERSDTTDAGGVLAVYDFVQASAGSTGSLQVTAGASQFSSGATVALTTAAAGGANLEASAALSGTGTLTADAQRTTFAESTLAGTGTLTAQAQRTTFASAALSGSSTLTADAQRTTFGNAALTGTGALTADAQRTAITSAALVGQGTLEVASTQRTTFALAALSGVGTLLAAFEALPQVLTRRRNVSLSVSRRNASGNANRRSANIS
jgi:hypothetical protein